MWVDRKSVSQAENAAPVFIKLKDPHHLAHQKQYPLKPEVKERVKHITENLKEQELKEQVTPSEGLPLPTNTSRLLASEPGLTPTGPLSAFSLKQRNRCWFGA